MSEGFVAKLQKRAYDNLEKFEKELNNYFPKQYVYGLMMKNFQLQIIIVKGH